MGTKMEAMVNYKYKHQPVFLLSMTLIFVLGVLGIRHIVRAEEEAKPPPKAAKKEVKEAKGIKLAYIYKAKLVRVLDGDTVEARVDLGFRVSITERFRLLGIDTPEVRGKEKEQGLVSKAFVERMLQRNEGTFYLKSIKTGKFGRWLATIYYMDENGEWQDLNKALLEKGLAKEYGK